MSSGGGTTVTNSTPWEGAQPYLRDIMAQGQNLYQNQANPPTPSVYTGYGIDQISHTASQPNPALNAAQGAVTNFAGGGATNNPQLDAMFGRAANQVRDYTNSQFTAAGRGGSTTNQYILGKNIGDLASSMYGNAYETGQNRQLTAAGLAPQLNAANYYGGQQLLGAGQVADQFNQNAYLAPWQQLQGYSGAVSGLGGLGGTSSQTAPKQSMLPSLLGAGLSAATLIPW